MVFNSLRVDNYERILPFAARNNIRVVVVDRRSTPYTPEEVNDLTSGRKIFLETVGLQVVQFLSAFLDENPEIPRASLDRRSGGLALLGWSLGAAWALAPLAHPEIPRSYIARLEPYLKDCIIQGTPSLLTVPMSTDILTSNKDAPFFALGYQNPAETAYNAWTDPDCKTPEELTNNFANWATQYFNHPDYSNYKSLDGLDYTKGGMINPSYGRMTAEEKQRIYDPTAGFSTDVAFPPGPIQAEALKQTMAALFDGELIKTVFPELRVFMIACLTSAVAMHHRT
jgi:hypothetical protein